MVRAVIESATIYAEKLDPLNFDQRLRRSCKPCQDAKASSASNICAVD